MTKLLLAIAVRLLLQAMPGSKPLPPEHPIMVRAAGAAEDLARELEAMPLSPEERETYGRVAFVWSFYESAWWASPPGSNDKGAACGVLQVHSPELFVPGATCGGLRADRRLGYRVGLLAMRHFVATCGGLRAGLTAYSTTGTCPKKGWTIRLVVDRLALAGVAQ